MKNNFYIDACFINRLDKYSRDNKNKTKRRIVVNSDTVNKPKMRLSQSFELQKAMGLTIIKSDKKHYDRDYLMSIKNLVTEKPLDLPTIPNVTIEGVNGFQKDNKFKNYFLLYKIEFYTNKKYG